MAEINAIRTMEARDVLSAKLATATVTVDGNRYLLFQAKNIEAKFTKSKKEVPILGRIMRGNKANGGSGTGKLTIYHNTALFDDMMKTYKDDASDLYFDLQITNYDPTSRAGANTIICTAATSTTSSSRRSTRTVIGWSRKSTSRSRIGRRRRSSPSSTVCSNRR